MKKIVAFGLIVYSVQYTYYAMKTNKMCTLNLLVRGQNEAKGYVWYVCLGLNV